MKLETRDKYSGFIIKLDKFLHTSRRVSKQQMRFSESECLYISKGLDTYHSGIDKRLYKISSCGCLVDLEYIGQSE